MAEEKQYPLSLIIRAVDKATGPLRAVNARIAQMTKPVRAVSNAFRGLAMEAGLPQMLNSFRGVGTALSSVRDQVGSLVMRVAALGLAAGVTMLTLIRGSVNAGDELGAMAQRLGMSVDTFAAFRFVAEQNDVSAEQLSSSMEQLNKRMGELRTGAGPLASFLKNEVGGALLSQLQGAKTNEEAMGLLADAMAKVKDPGKRAALAVHAFGRAGAAMAPMLAKGGMAIQQQMLRYMELSGSQEKFAAGAGAVDEAMRETETALLGVRNALMGELFPAFTDISKTVTAMLVEHREPIREWAKQFAQDLPGHIKDFSESVKKLKDDLGPLIDKVMKVCEWLGDGNGLKGALIAAGAIMGAPTVAAAASLALSLGKLSFAIGRVVLSLGTLVFGPIIAAMGTFVTAIAAGSGVMGAFNMVLLANPIGAVVLAVAALAGAVYLIYENWGPINAWLQKNVWGPVTGALVTAAKFWGSYFSETWDGMKETFGNAWSYISERISAAWEVIRPIIDAMKAAAEMTFAPVIKLANMGGSLLSETGPGGVVADAVSYWTDPPERPILGADNARPLDQRLSGKVAVTVDVNGLPKSSRANVSSDGAVSTELSTGYGLSNAEAL